MVVIWWRLDVANVLQEAHVANIPGANSKTSNKVSFKKQTKKT